MRRFSFLLAIVFCLPAAATAQQTSSSAQTAAAFVAGLHPYQRPDGAPIVKEEPLSEDKLKTYLHGVSTPVPGNVELITATGNWFVPMRYRGMPGLYDIRGWYDTAIQ